MSNFIVTCHGWSASNWTAHSLNLHNTVLCTHSARNVPADDKDLQSNKNLKKHINQLQKGYALRQNRSLDDIYDEIESFGENKNYGSVHVIRLRDIPVIHKKYGSPNRPFKIANVVRHPVDLVWSGFGQFKDLFRYDINELYWTTGKVVRSGLEFVNELSRKYNFNAGDFEYLAFLGACAVLESLKFDLDAYQNIDQVEKLDYVGTYRMEDLTKDPEYFKGFFESLLPDENADPLYLQSVFNTGQINKHKHDNKKLTPEERYDTFEEWQKEAFHYFFDKFGLFDGYSSFGYELEFMKEVEVF